MHTAHYAMTPKVQALSIWTAPFKCFARMSWCLCCSSFGIYSASLLAPHTRTQTHVMSTRSGCIERAYSWTGPTFKPCMHQDIKYRKPYAIANG